MSASDGHRVLISFPTTLGRQRVVIAASSLNLSVRQSAREPEVSPGGGASVVVSHISREHVHERGKSVSMSFSVSNHMS